MYRFELPVLWWQLNASMILDEVVVVLFKRCVMIISLTTTFLLVVKCDSRHVNVIMLIIRINELHVNSPSVTLLGLYFTVSVV